MSKSAISIDQINQCLPQTQCGECGYPGCLPYAKAIVKQNEAIDRCPPGGTRTLTQLAELLEIDPQPYLAAMQSKTRPPALAFIRENECIGCTKCIQACPVDAIIGAAKRMHTVLQQECTGCGLCVPPCPVDCIDLQPIVQAQYNRKKAQARYTAKQTRISNGKNKTTRSLAIENTAPPGAAIISASDADKKTFIAAAILRAKQKKGQA